MSEAGPQVFPSVEMLCIETGLDESTVRAHLNAAVKGGWLTHDRERGEFGASAPGQQKPPGASATSTEEDLADARDAQERKELDDWFAQQSADTQADIASEADAMVERQWPQIERRPPASYRRQIRYRVLKRRRG